MDGVDGMDGMDASEAKWFLIGSARKSAAHSSGGRRAGLETRDTIPMASREVCGTTTGQRDSFFHVGNVRTHPSEAV